MQRYFLSLADQIALPLYLYNYPKSTHFNLVPEVVRQLQQHPNIMGIKDSSGDKAYMNALIEISKETAFNVLIGPEEILTELLLQGAQGGVNGGSNMFPSLYTQLYKATLKNDFDQREQLQKLVMQLSEGVYALEGGVNSYLKGIKAAAAALGLCKNILSPPLKAAESDIADSIASTVQDIKSTLKKI
jgi:dihydrodipicolinate synthase/N-acetylneuraminate lyase